MISSRIDREIFPEAGVFEQRLIRWDAIVCRALSSLGEFNRFIQFGVLAERWGR